MRHLGGLAVYIVEDAERLWQRLRLFNVERERLASMGDAWWRIAPTIGEHGARTLMYRLGAERYIDRVLLAWSRARAGASDAAWRNLATLPARWTAPSFPLRAADLITRGVPKGPPLGAALRAAEEAWIAADFPMDKVSIGAIADRAATSVA